MILNNIRAWFSSSGVTFREAHHEPTRTSEESARARGEELRIGGKALVQEPAAYQALIAARKIALFAAAPFIGLVYAMLMPFFGLAMIAKIGYQAYKAPRQVA